MRSTLLLERRKQTATHLEHRQPPLSAAAKAQDQRNIALIVVGFSVVAFHLAAGITGLMALWIYFGQTLASFSP